MTLEYTNAALQRAKKMPKLKSLLKEKSKEGAPVSMSRMKALLAATPVHKKV